MRARSINSLWHQFASREPKLKHVSATWIAATLERAGLIAFDRTLGYRWYRETGIMRNIDRFPESVTELLIAALSGQEVLK